MLSVVLGRTVGADYSHAAFGDGDDRTVVDLLANIAAQLVFSANHLSRQQVGTELF